MSTRYQLSQVPGGWVIWDSTDSTYIMDTYCVGTWAQAVRLFKTEGEAKAEVARLLEVTYA